MAGVRISWELPTTRVSGKPLKFEDIKLVVIEASADLGANFAPIGEYTPDILETELPEIDAGTWVFRGVVVDTKDRSSPPVEGTIEIEDNTPPAALTLTLSAI